MVVQDFGGAHDVNGDAEMEAILATRYGQGVNEIWLTHEGHEYPAILILANGELACVHYFPEEFDPGYQSVGTKQGVDPEGSTTFFVNTPTEPVYVLNTAIVPFSLACQAAKEFSKSSKLPRCIEWFRL